MLHAAAVHHPSRRLTATILAIAMLGFAAFAAMRPAHAGAGLAWCASDPIISVNGKLISVNINVPVDKVKSVKSATVTFHVPRNVDARIVFVDQTWFPERAYIVKDNGWWDGREALEVEVDVYVDGEGPAFAIGVEVADQARASTWYNATTDRLFSFEAYGFVWKR